jgi:hypothetical protein
MDTLFQDGFKTTKLLKGYINFTNVHISKSLEPNNGN